METQSLGLESVKEYYGKILKTSQDLQTSACCTTESMPEHIKPILREIHPEVTEKFYGCGSPLPLALEGANILDLGSGSGRDCYLLSKLVGETGSVIGVDMTDEQLAVAQKHVGYHTEKFGFKKPNIQFRKGYIEDLSTVDIVPNSMDLVTSNCVVNLSPDKRKVFSEVFRVLKPGGEFYFSDVFASRRLPKEIREDDVFIGECLGGALYTEDFRRMMSDVGCKDYRLIASAKIDLLNPKLAAQAGPIVFYSMTVRAFKLPLEDRCEDFGQLARYKGSIAHSETAFRLDDHHLFEKGKWAPVCGNTADMLQNSRFGKHFEIMGDKSTHFGLFDCGPMPTTQAADTNVGACC